MAQLSIGRTGQLYVKAETTYATAPTLAAANAIRHRNYQQKGDNFNRQSITEKQQGPGQIAALRADRRKQADWQLETFLRAGGVINTLSEGDPVLSAGFGTSTNPTLSTTFSGTPTVSGGTVASVTGLAPLDFVAITCPDGKVRVRQLGSGAVTTSLTWNPDLPAGQAPASGAALRGMTTYKLTSALAASLYFAHFLKKVDGTTSHIKRAVSGAVVDKLAFEFDANEEPILKASGPACQIIPDASVAAQPGGFTRVGGTPPSGITGEFLINDTAVRMVKLSAEIENAMRLRNMEYGDSAAIEAYRAGRRVISLNLDMFFENPAHIYDLALAGTNVEVFKQTGFTAGNIIALRAPLVEFPTPDIDDPDDEVKAPLKGMALESSDGANDALYLGIA